MTVGVICHVFFFFFFLFSFFFLGIPMGWSGLDIHETGVLEGQVGRVDEAVSG